MGRGANMPESIMITLPRAMPMVERILGVSKRISEWLESLEKPFKVEKDELLLTRYEQNDKDYSYHYIINRSMKSPKEK